MDADFIYRKEQKEQKETNRWWTLISADSTGLKVRKVVAQGKASLRATPWVHANKTDRVR